MRIPGGFPRARGGGGGGRRGWGGSFVDVFVGVCSWMDGGLDWRREGRMDDRGVEGWIGGRKG